MELQPIQYYYEGWRAGYLLSIHRNGTARVLPLQPMYSTKKARARRVKITDVRPIPPATKLVAPRKGGFMLRSHLDPLTGKPWQD